MRPVAILTRQKVTQDVVAQIQEQRSLGVERAVVKDWEWEVIESIVLQLKLLEVGEAIEGAGVDVADLVVGEDEGYQVGKVPEGPGLYVLDEVPRQHDGLELGHAAELARSHHSEFIKGQPDVSEIFVHIFVEQVCRDPLKFVRL